LERKEEGKESTDDIRRKLELLYGEIARSKEEALLKQQTLESEREKVRERGDVWDFLSGQVTDKIEKTSKLNREGYPLDMESRALALNTIQNTGGGTFSALKQLKDLFTLRQETLRDGMTMGAARRTIIVGKGETVTAHVLRVGHLTAWAMNEEGRLFMMTSLGQAASFEWSEITEPRIKEYIKGKFPLWMQNKRISGALPIDILQNERTRDLVDREETGIYAKARQFALAGGPILIPLGLIVLWAIFLIINRWFFYYTGHRRNNRLLKRVIHLLSRNKIVDAQKLVEKKRGLGANIVKLCLNLRERDRDTAERAVEEYFLKENPRLDRYLDTISVLAGASPLLGLLGTVTGMIRLFDVITQVGTGDPKMMAGGISEALITTECGLAIAIPLVLIHNWLRSRRNLLVSDAEMYAVQILNRLWPSMTSDSTRQSRPFVALVESDRTGKKEQLPKITGIRRAGDSD
jgi:biopolymer transport protein ExbB